MTLEGDANQPGELGLAVEAVVSTGKYLRRFVDYAATFGADDRTVKRWAAVGRAAKPPDAPPLDRPREMPAWWARHFHRRVPAGILAAAACDQDVPVPTVQARMAGSGDAVAGAVTPTGAATGGDGDLFAGTGIADTLRRLRDAEREAGEAYIEALKPRKRTNEQGVEETYFLPSGEIDLLRRRWNDLTEQYRKTMKDEAANAEARGDLLDKATVARELREIHAVIGDRVRRLVAIVRPKLAGKSPEEQDRVWDDELIRTLEPLQNELLAA